MHAYRMIAAGSALLTALVMAVGCTSVERGPRLGGIYNKTAQYHGPPRNPVIVIPGILGSKLIEQHTGQIVWGAFADGYANPKHADGARLFALPMEHGQALSDLTDATVSDGSLERVTVSVLGLHINLRAYVHILSTLGVGSYRDEPLGRDAIDYGPGHFTCFQFDYDWRRDNVENARRLDAFIKEKRAYIQEQYKLHYGIEGGEVKFDIVAHSMGGLVARYYLRYGDADLPSDGSQPEVTWAGAEHVRRLVLVGTPNAGSAKAMDELLHGADIGPTLPTYSPAILGTMPSIYQLLPRGRHGAMRDAQTGKTISDLYDPELWQQMRWGLASPKQDKTLRVLLPEVKDPEDRRRIALDHQAKCLNRARLFAQALDAPAAPPDGTTIHLFAGDAEQTLAVLQVKPDGTVSPQEHRPGDGTVLRSSALMDERVDSEWSPKLVSPITWSSVQLIFTDHLGMTKDPAFSDNVLYLLLEAP
jgi:pimeloyl-ACP methyl ester carboxylesterase